MAADAPGFAVAAVRPHLIWGPGDAQLTERVVARARAGRMVLVGDGAALVDSTYLDDAAGAIVAALDRLGDDGHEGVHGRAFVVTSGQPLTIGENVTVGHQVMLHGCTIGDNTLIGIQSVILNGARIGRNCIVGAGSLVTEGKEFPDNSLIVGSPAKVVRTLDEAAAAKLTESGQRYVQNAQRHSRGLKKMA